VSTSGPGQIRTFAFGDLATRIWGAAAAWPGGAVASFAPSVTTDDGDGRSVLSADGVELRFVPLAAPAALAPTAAGLLGSAQLCTIEGAIRHEGAEHEVSCLGVRGTLSLPLPASASARAASAWFGPQYAVAVAALRPQKSRGHSADVVAGAVLDDGAALAVDEPRLSTTYDGSGVPMRVGLEVWLEDIVVDGEEPRPQYPRRLAGEATGERAHAEAAGFALDAQLFRWHARGLEGAGVYVLVERA
jgi:hypothetical protein